MYHVSLAKVSPSFSLRYIGQGVIGFYKVFCLFYPFFHLFFRFFGIAEVFVPKHTAFSFLLFGIQFLDRFFVGHGLTFRLLLRQLLLNTSEALVLLEL